MIHTGMNTGKLTRSRSQGLAFASRVKDRGQWLLVEALL